MKVISEAEFFAIFTEDEAKMIKQRMMLTIPVSVVKKLLQDPEPITVPIFTIFEKLDTKQYYYAELKVRYAQADDADLDRIQLPSFKGATVRPILTKLSEVILYDTEDQLRHAQSVDRLTHPSVIGKN